MSDNRRSGVAVETGAISLAAGDWCGVVNSIGAGIWWGRAAGLPQQLVARTRTYCNAVVVVFSVLKGVKWCL